MDIMNIMDIMNMDIMDIMNIMDIMDIMDIVSTMDIMNVMDCMDFMDIRNHVQLDVRELSSCLRSRCCVALLLGYLQLMVLGQGILPDRTQLDRNRTAFPLHVFASRTATNVDHAMEDHLLKVRHDDGSSEFLVAGRLRK